MKRWSIHIALILVFLAIYLNIGFALGYYYYTNIAGHDYRSASVLAKTLGGHCWLFSMSPSSLWGAELSVSIIWPLLMFVSVIAWIMHVIYWIAALFISAFLSGLYWLGWLIFFGGLAKLLGIL